MEQRITVLGVELIVDDLERAVSLFVDGLGFELHDRRPADRIAGELAVVTDGRLAITLLWPTTSGHDHVLPDRRPRFSQLVLGSEPGEVDVIAGRLIDAGIGLNPTASGAFISPEVVSGILGVDTAVVLTTGT